MAEQPREPFHPAPNLTADEWRVLDEVRAGGPLHEAAARLRMPEKRLRLYLRNAAEKLRMAGQL